MRQNPRPYDVYKHFKGNLYQVLTVAEHSESGEQLVIYQAMYGDFKIYARELSMFMEKVDTQKYPDATQEYRFELIRSGDQPFVRTAQEGADARIEAETFSRTGGEASSQAGADHSTSGADHSAFGADHSTSGADHSASGGEIEEVPDIDPMVLEFLDADTYEERLNILSGLHHRITDDMITTMAIASDIEVPEGDTQQRYQELRNCLVTLEKYECNRLR